VPPGGGIAALAAAAAHCTACELAGPATQTVFAKGSPLADVVLVGEQPGDAEDLAGRPFVGPAGRLLDRALDAAGLDPARCYVTNAVKHFRFRLVDGAGGRQRRLHVTPDLAHLTACAPWLQAELAVLDPTVVVALGATAARALLGPQVRVTRDRGRLLVRPGDPAEPLRRRAGWWLVTTHPSAVLRAEDTDAAFAALVADLQVVRAATVP
jgi:DNA polymerase